MAQNLQNERKLDYDGYDTFLAVCLIKSFSVFRSTKLTCAWSRACYSSYGLLSSYYCCITLSIELLRLLRFMGHYGIWGEKGCFMIMMVYLVFFFRVCIGKGRGVG